MKGENNVNKTKKKDDLKESSIVFLQRLWKNKFKLLTTYHIIKYSFSIGVTIKHIKSISYESLVVFLKEKQILSASKVLFQRIHKLCILRHGNNNTSIKIVNIGEYLVAFIIACHHNYVFQEINTLENALIEVSIQMLTTFENICNIIHTSAKHNFQDVPYEFTKDFIEILSKYLKYLREWKISDETKVICRIKTNLIKLYQQEKYLLHNKSINHKYIIELQTQIEILRNKLKIIAGLEMLKQFDEERNYLITSKNEYDNLVNDRTNSIFNEQLIHEILLNPKFQFNEYDNSNINNPIFYPIKKFFNEDFWKNLEDDFKYTIPSYTRLLQILIVIREGINNITKYRNADYMIEIIDINYIKQQIETKMYTWNNCIELILSILKVIKQIQSQERDKETKEKWELINQQMIDASININEQPQTLCKALKFARNHINAIRIDIVNAQIKSMVPIIKDTGIDYERSKFQDKLVNGTFTLERTQNWIHLNLRNEIASKAVDLENLLVGNSYAFIHVHKAAMLSLITNPTTITSEICPETLYLDVDRLFMLQQEFEYIVTSITIIIKVSHSIMATKNVADMQVLTNIIELFTPETKLKIDLEEIITEIDKAIQYTSLSQDNREILLRNLKESILPTDTVRIIIYQRITILWKKIMKDGIIPDDLNFIKNAKALIPRIEKAVLKLLSLTNLNQTIYIIIYNKLIGEETLKLKAEC